MDKDSGSSIRYDAALLLVVVIWGLNFPIIKVPLEVMHPFTVNLFRFLVSIVTLSLFWIYEARRSMKPLASAVTTWPLRIIGLGLMGHVGYQVLFILGIARTEAGSAALLIASSPVWTAIIGHLLRIEMLRSKQWLGLLIGFVGVVVVVLAGSGTLEFSNETFLGNVLMLFGAIFWALYTVLSKPLLARGVPPIGLTFFGVLAAMPVLAILGLATLHQTNWDATDSTTWLALVFSGGLSTGLAYALWNMAVKRVGPAQTAIFSNLVPFVALIAAYYLLGEVIALPQLGGGVMIIAGLILLRRG